jgi:hypothetical protein
MSLSSFTAAVTFSGFIVSLSRHLMMLSRLPMVFAGHFSSLLLLR